MEGVAYVEQAPPGLGESLARGVGEPGGGDGTQRGGVAQAASGLLEVGFEQELKLALAFGALGAQVAEFGKALGGLVAPVGEDGGAQRGGQAEVSGQVAGVQETEVDLEVLARRLPGLLRGAYGVVQVDAEVPDRVPEAVGECGDGLVVPAVVQQEQVQVAAR